MVVAKLLRVRRLGGEAESVDGVQVSVGWTFRLTLQSVVNLVEGHDLRYIWRSCPFLKLKSAE